jgi:FkbM family methyltransferase
LARFQRARVLCFEPLAGPRKALNAVAKTEPDRVEVFPFAAAAQNGSPTMQVSLADDSSSLLPIGHRYVTAFPGTESRGTASVHAVRIDEVIHDVNPPCLMKVDVQGYELEVLKGAEKLLPQISHLIVECSFTELYLGQPLAGEVVGYLTQSGYSFSGVFDLKRDRAGHCLSADLLFERVK